MAHFALLNDQSQVVDVVVVSDIDMIGPDGMADEETGRLFLERLTGEANWKQSAQDGSIRARGAVIGAHYDAGHDVFTSVPIEDGLIWSDDAQDYIWEIPPALVAGIVEITPEG